VLLLLQLLLQQGAVSDVLLQLLLQHGWRAADAKAGRRGCYRRSPLSRRGCHDV
jgi:hypothetical protein